MTPDRPRRIMVTGGAGFIGSAVCRHFIGSTQDLVCNVDMLTYASCPEALAGIAGDRRYRFEQLDICDGAALARIMADFRPNAVVHLAAETHVDRSIDDASGFVASNIVGTYRLLETVRDYLGSAGTGEQGKFRFVHVSTDEVFGSLADTGRFTETSRYAPNSPYAASKAASDHLVRAWAATYGLPAIIANSSNNFGPFQYPEKLIPLTIANAIDGRRISVYGSGRNVRDWMHVEDHARALDLILRNGAPGETYLVGGAGGERRNIDVVEAICAALDEMLPEAPFRPHRRLIEFVADRPGHDRRYAVDSSKLKSRLGWRPRATFDVALRGTVRWHVEHRDWWSRIRQTGYDGRRLGAGSGRQDEFGGARAKA